MTRACMYCGEAYGEMCPHCGGKNLIFRWSTALENAVQTFKIFTCLNALCPGLKLSAGSLAPSFKEGEGPKGQTNYVSHGICRGCLRLPEDERMRRYYARTQGGDVVAVTRAAEVTR